MPTRFYLRRLAILGVVGLFHGLFLWFGDILFPYALAGLVLYILRGRAPKTLAWIAIPLFVLGIALSTAMTGLESLESSKVPSDSSAASFLGIEGSWEDVERRA
ncbi:MAG: hypothetical protein MPN21_08955 [Thermoanaerobaculia bacterium]|nr:hypothetical protein [Thermoanaerobaculia bacterium]